MFNAEKLLGKVISEVIGTGSKKGKGSLLNSLTSGAGLMTVIGLGVGAFEIFTEKQKQASAANYPPQQHSPVPPPPPNWSGSAEPPPPPPPPVQPSSPVTPVQQLPASETPQNNTEELSIRMIQVMIAAAHADGTLDPTEEQAILERTRKAGLSQEERMFLLDELHKPKNIDELTNGITDPSVAKTMYLLAASAVEIDTEAERLWLDRLAGGLGLSKAVQSFIEEQS